MDFSAHSYGPAVAAFLNKKEGPNELSKAAPLTLFPGARFPREAMSGLWLHFDDLDRSHHISQELSTQEASFWHGIMHRREPDPSNAAYWFRRVGRHALFPALQQAAQEAGYPSSSTEWNPYAWIDYWERARRRPGSEEHGIAMAVQQIEWELLFDYCARAES
jgi:hypothetical protein